MSRVLGPLRTHLIALTTLLTAFALPACQGPAPQEAGRAAAVSPPAPRDAADTRIAVARETLAAAPLLYPVWAELGEAWLDRARVTRAPEDVAEAHAAFTRSLTIQENAVALRGLIALANYRHRFEEALEYVPRARAAWREDTTVLAMEVEALLALERVTDARAALAGQTFHPSDLYGRSAAARVLLAEGHVDAAAEEFLGAAEQARPVSPALARWATVRAAAAYIDTGSPERAAPLLANCLAEAPDDVDALVHRAEVEAANGETAAALATYERALALADDPMLHASAAPLARALGDTARAAQHAEVAERELGRALAAGEDYTRHALATLRAALGEARGET